MQPVPDRPFTQIQNGSRWQNQVHLGTEYAALLVEPGYHPPETAESLPSTGDGVDAIAVVQDKRAPASSTQPKLLHFSGYDWTVRTAASNRAGTRNSFDPANAWTDERGALHLRIARSKDKWTCAEVKLTRSLGYGTYTFVVRDTSQLEPSAILTLLTWDGIGGEPDLVILGGPGQSEDAGEVAECFRFPFSSGIDDDNGTTVIAAARMPAECNTLPIARDARMADPGRQGHLVHHIAGGILDAVLVVDAAND